MRVSSCSASASASGTSRLAMKNVPTAIDSSLGAAPPSTRASATRSASPAIIAGTPTMCDWVPAPRTSARTSPWVVAMTRSVLELPPSTARSSSRERSATGALRKLGQVGGVGLQQGIEHLDGEVPLADERVREQGPQREVAAAGPRRLDRRAPRTPSPPAPARASQGPAARPGRPAVRRGRRTQAPRRPPRRAGRRSCPCCACPRSGARRPR